MQPRSEASQLVRPGRAASRTAPAALGLVLAIAALSRLDVRTTAICLAAAVVALGIPAVARWPAALLVGFGVMRGGLPAVGGAVALLLAVALWPRPKALGRRLLVVLATAALVGLASASLRPAAAALAAVAVLVAPFEQRLPRFAPALALLVASVPGALAFAQAYRTRLVARADGTEAAWSTAQAACTSVSWTGCEEDALLARAKLAQSAGDRGRALALLDAVPFPARPATELAHADAELALGKPGPAHARLAHLAELHPTASAKLSPAAALDWAHALAQAGHRDLAQQVADWKPLPRVEAAANEHDFADALLVTVGAPPPTCVKRGEVPPLAFSWRVADGLAPDQVAYAFVHAYGPGRTLFFDHLPGGRSTLTPGARFEDRLTAPVPLDAPAGRYKVNLGVYTPDDGLRLPVRGQPGHIRFIDAGSFEVCP